MIQNASHAHKNQTLSAKLLIQKCRLQSPSLVFFLPLVLKLQHQAHRDERQYREYRDRQRLHSQIRPHQPLHTIPLAVTRFLQQTTAFLLPRLALHRFSLLQRIQDIPSFPCSRISRGTSHITSTHPRSARSIKNRDWRSSV